MDATNSTQFGQRGNRLDARPKSNIYAAGTGPGTGRTGIRIGRMNRDGSTAGLSALGAATGPLSQPRPLFLTPRPAPQAAPQQPPRPAAASQTQFTSVADGLGGSKMVPVPQAKPAPATPAPAGMAPAATPGVTPPAAPKPPPAPATGAVPAGGQAGSATFDGKSRREFFADAAKRHQAENAFSQDRSALPATNADGSKASTATFDGKSRNEFFHDEADLQHGPNAYSRDKRVFAPDSVEARAEAAAKAKQGLLEGDAIIAKGKKVLEDLRAKHAAEAAQREVAKNPKVLWPEHLAKLAGYYDTSDKDGNPIPATGSGRPFPTSALNNPNPDPKPSAPADPAPTQAPPKGKAMNDYEKFLMGERMRNRFRPQQKL